MSKRMITSLLSVLLLASILLISGCGNSTTQRVATSMGAFFDSKTTLTTSSDEEATAAPFESSGGLWNLVHLTDKDLYYAQIDGLEASTYQITNYHTSHRDKWLDTYFSCGVAWDTNNIMVVLSLKNENHATKQSQPEFSITVNSSAEYSLTTDSSASLSSSHLNIDDEGIVNEIVLLGDEAKEFLNALCDGNVYIEANARTSKHERFQFIVNYPQLKLRACKRSMVD